MRLWLATGNAGKVRDFAAMGLGIEWAPIPGFASLPGIDESGTTFEANARLKAEHYSRLVGGLLVADDSGLEVTALQGAPGVYSARFSGPGATDASNNQLLLEQMREVPEENRDAAYVCCLALAENGRTLATFFGRTEGRILFAPQGTGGFGYDPLFFAHDAGCVMAEMDLAAKAEISHRGRAARKLADWLKAARRIG